MIYCPCKLCAHHYVPARDILYVHLKLNGMNKCCAQSRWVHHRGAKQSQSNKTYDDHHVHGEENGGHDMQDMLKYAFGFYNPNGIGAQVQHHDEPNAEANASLKLVEDMNKSLHSGCEEFSTPCLLCCYTMQSIYTGN